MSEPKLIYDIGRKFTAHDIRKLRPCAMCNQIGYLPQMLTLDGKHYHSACIAKSLSPDEILALPYDEMTKLRLNETGPELMGKMLDRVREDD